MFRVVVITWYKKHSQQKNRQKKQLTKVAVLDVAYSYGINKSKFRNLWWISFNRKKEYYKTTFLCIGLHNERAKS